MDLILRTRYAAALRLDQEPEWVWSYQTPSERILRRALAIQHMALSDAEKQIASLEAKLNVERRYADLLHAKGDGPLASVIRDVLVLLGAVMTPHVETGSDDGRFEDPFGRKYVLEAKGTNGATAKTHLRQLDEWVDTAVADKWQATGLLIINWSADKPLTARPEIVHRSGPMNELAAPKERRPWRSYGHL